MKILKQYWIGVPEDDLCSHGDIFLRVGDTVLLDGKDGEEWNISESALSLLRTVKNDFPNNDKPLYYPKEMINEEYEIFHCGCFMMFCPFNVGWKVKHKQNIVELFDLKKNDGEIIYSDIRIAIPLIQYVNEIYNFALTAKDFYLKQSKNFEQNEMFEGQFNKFWMEFDELLNYVFKLINKG
ncbi:hypothetical protein [Bacillus sp. AFS053548]|uniref:hypothetical protein n=1 Tax=Bacillus sp. AFS053548 TaxID=2033505 RepID=UPI000BFDF8F7|nr:hypothetical protein [Bacillus sp. AFS053548]PGM50742.1 hypothetical protein CN946_20720 [Bacillus sp. AFS053548]